MHQPYPLLVTKRVRCLFPLLMLLAPALLFARQDWAICGTDPMRSLEEKALHENWRRSAAFRTMRAASVSTPRAQPAIRDIGNIAVVDDDSGVVARRNPFDLTQKTLRFEPASANAASYSYSTAA